MWKLKWKLAVWRLRRQSAAIGRLQRARKKTAQEICAVSKEYDYYPYRSMPDFSDGSAMDTVSLAMCLTERTTPQD